MHITRGARGREAQEKRRGVGGGPGWAQEADWGYSERPGSRRLRSGKAGRQGWWREGCVEM
eukprot:7135806-Alexandrium_andersonii.AAC.1